MSNAEFGVLTIIYFFVSTVLALYWNTSRVGTKIRDVDFLIGAVIIIAWLDRMINGVV